MYDTNKDEMVPLITVRLHWQAVICTSIISKGELGSTNFIQG